ncbi:BatD family protein [Vibrio sp. S4M6]|uniref:BatD family protein n=1 Tax=Vibrio sinus TaxID=2946865 RepID=UPI00202A1705|nr:BatD family protein [Vibrio sinus]MCL9780596.1 BatD family protein [Vibrio sinus]
MKTINSLLSRFSALVMVCLSLASMNVMAANLWASVNTNKVAKNEMFQLQIATDQKASSNAIDFNVLAKDFYLSQPSFGTYQDSVNGKTSMRTTWTISLAPKRLGTLTIPKFTLNGESSQPINIHVTMNSSAPKAEDLVEMQATLDKHTLYPEESAYLKTRLIIKTDPRSLQNPQIIPPVAKGLNLTPIGEQKQYQSILKGVSVTVVDQDYRVTANKPGHFVLHGPSFRGNILYVSNKTGSTTILNANTKAKSFDFTVEPKPANYSGYWLPTPKLTLTQKWVNESGHEINDAQAYNTQVGDSITRIITMDVDGLTAEQLPNIVTHYPSSIRVYADKPQFETLPNHVTRMTLKQVLIPQQPGKIQLENINIRWWNSHSKKQQTSKLAGLSLNVTPGSNQDAVAPPTSPLPTTTEKTVTVKDSGYWPYVTLTFGLLWLLTLAYLVKVKVQQRKSTNRESNSTSPTDDLTAAIKSGNAIQAQFLANRWLDSLNNRDETLEKQIKQELESMQRQAFKPDKYGDEVNVKELLDMIHRLEKKQRRIQAQETELAQL